MEGLMRDVMNGNISVASLSRWLGLGDTEFWKGALIVLERSVVSLTTALF
jgi:hypothetical protein